jgi:hypothetical protein
LSRELPDPKVQQINGGGLQIVKGSPGNGWNDV